MTQQFSRNSLVGRWFRSDTLNDGRRYCELATLTKDGKFEFNFVTYALDGGVNEDITEFGLWGLVGNIHFTITEAEGEANGSIYEADLEHEDNYHAYLILHLADDEFQYQHLLTGETFTMKRVVE